MNNPPSPVGAQRSVPPLKRTESRWVPISILSKQNKPVELTPIETVQLKVKGLLNKLTLEKFDIISDQIIEYANKSREEREGRILKEVVRLIFEHLCDEPNFSQMYADLCRRMTERIDPDLVDENLKTAEGKFVRGGTLFRKYVLNRCQEDFDKGWKVSIHSEKGEPILMSDEYYAAAKVKRHGLGVICFIGGLFKVNMITESAMHEHIQKLLTAEEEEEKIESLCKLLTVVGKQLDHKKAKSHVDKYFARLEDILRNTKLSSRMRFMILVRLSCMHN